MRSSVLAASALMLVCGAEGFTSPLLRGASVTRHSAAAAVPRPRAAFVAPLRMADDGASTQESLSVDEATGNFLAVDGNGNKVILTLEAQEKKYLDACNAFYNDKKPILSDGDFNELRENLAFSGSDVATMNRMEIMFMCAANRYAEGKPIMSDEEFDKIRRVLKQRNSIAVVHKVPACRVDTNTCKGDLAVDNVKNAILYLPSIGMSIPIVLFLSAANEFINGPGNPIINFLINVPMIAIISYVVKNFILFQEALVTSGSCPLCYTDQNIYFGDIVFCNDGAKDEISTQCINTACACSLKASRSRMILESEFGQPASPKAPAKVVKEA